MIGDHGCTFNHKSSFIYRSHTQCEGFFVRKRNWHLLMEEPNEITNQKKQMIIRDYFYRVQIKVLSMKRRMIDQLEARSDIHQIIQLTSKHHDDDFNFLMENVKDLKY